MKPIGTLAVMGLGLMGGSLAMAARRKGVAGTVRGYARRQETRELAMRSGAVDEVSGDPAAVAAGADLVVFCLPILTIPVMAAECRPAVTSRTVVTDVGSTKAFLTAEMTAILNGTGAVFVGSHPIAGSEATGLEAAQPDLYDGAVTIVTPADIRDERKDRASSAVNVVVSLWEALGSTVRVLSPQAHDRLLARTSHLPHVAAALLVDNAFRAGVDGTRDACGSGFRDATRIAAGSENVWHDIVKTNASAISLELESYVRRAEDLRRLMDQGRFEEVREFLARCRGIRVGLHSRGNRMETGRESGDAHD